MINWISLEDRFPNNDRDVLVINKYVPYTVLTTFYQNGQWFESIASNALRNYSEYNFTHWAELSDINIPE